MFFLRGLSLSMYTRRAAKVTSDNVPSISYTRALVILRVVSLWERYQLW